MSKPQRASLAQMAVPILFALIAVAAVPANADSTDFNRNLDPVNDMVAAALSDVAASDNEVAELTFARDSALEAAALDLALDTLLVIIGAEPEDDPARRATLMQAVKDTFPMQRIVGDLGRNLGLSLDDLGDVVTLRLLMLWSMAASQPMDPEILAEIVPGLRERVGRVAATPQIMLPEDDMGRQLLADLTLYALIMDVQTDQSLEGNPRSRALQDRFVTFAGRPYRDVDLRSFGDSVTQDPPTETTSTNPQTEDAEFDSVWVRMGHTGTGFTFHPRMLFDDGTVTRDIGASPETFDVAASRLENPDDWGTWQRSGDEFVKRFPNDSRDFRFAIPGQIFEAREAPRNLRLDGRYMSLNTMSVPLMGGTQVTAAWRSFDFTPDGRFVNARGASTSAPGLAGHALPPDQRGHYTIDGYTIWFRFDDGREEHRLFFLFPEGASGDTDTIGIGGSVYVKR